MDIKLSQILKIDFLTYKIEEIFEKRGVKIEKNHIFYFFIKEKFWFFLLRYLHWLSNPLRVSELFLFWKSGNKQKSLLLNGEKAVWKTGVRSGTDLQISDKNLEVSGNIRQMSGIIWQYLADLW